MPEGQGSICNFFHKMVDSKQSPYHTDDPSDPQITFLSKPTTSKSMDMQQTAPALDMHRMPHSESSQSTSLAKTKTIQIAGLKFGRGFLNLMGHFSADNAMITKRITSLLQMGVVF